MTLAYIAVGSNMGKREDYVNQARQMVSRLDKAEFLQSSRVYETEPVGGPPQGKYLNVVWKIKTALAAKELLQELLKVERKLGRVRTARNAPRTVDLDILFYGDQVIEERGLRIPHPRLHEREFVLKPLMDLCPEFVHPILKRSVRELWEDQNQKVHQKVPGTLRPPKVPGTF